MAGGSFAVLHEPPVTSPRAAVRAAIEAEHKVAEDHEQRWFAWHPGEPKE